MKKLSLLKTYETFNGDGNVVNSASDQQIRDFVKRVVATKQYFQLLRETTHQVFMMLGKSIPDNIDDLANVMYEKDEIFAQLMDSLSDNLFNSLVMDEIDELLKNIIDIETYTEDNMDNILNKKVEFSEEETDDDDDEEDDDEEDEGEEQDIPKDDSKEQHNLPVGESLKSLKDLDDYVKTHKKTNDKFSKGDIVYINGITTETGKKLNGKEAKIIRKTKDKENCYDLFVSSLPSRSGEANLNGMPDKYLIKSKPSEIKDVQTIKENPKAKRYKK